MVDVALQCIVHKGIATSVDSEGVHQRYCCKLL
jgi:hypothetical protein